MLLALAAAVLADRGWELRSIRRMKFTRVLAPDTPVEITVAGSAAGAQIAWAAEGHQIAAARVTLGRPDG